MRSSSRDIYQDICSKIKSKPFANKLSTSRISRDDIDRLIKGSALRAHEYYPRLEGDKDALVQKVVEEMGSEQLTQNLKGDIGKYQAREQIFFDEHKQLAKIEHAQGRRALLWRAATTFTIASIIFFFYWLAGCLGISMPLSRVGL